MLSHYRPGLTRAKIILTVVGGALVLLLAVAAIESWSFTQLIKQGAVDTLDGLSFANKFSAEKNAAPTLSQTTANVEAKDRPSMGSDNAPIRVVEFVDFSCPYSKEESAIVREVATANPERVWLQIRDFPIDDLHPNARAAATAAACVNEQGKYWAMYDTLFANQASDGSFTNADLRRYAIGVGADGTKFDACMKAGAAAARVKADADAGATAQVTGTPTFFVNGYKIDGAIPADFWQKILKLAK